MKILAKPFNLKGLLIPTPAITNRLLPVTTLDTFDSTGVNFHDDGLFSVPIFGRLGSDDRDERFSYIDLRTNILHPEVFLIIKSLKGLYPAIMSGKRYAKWDEEEKDFVPANVDDGDTGFSFFIKHLPNINFQRNKSDTRNEKIALLEKFKDNLRLTRFLVLPAGYRDIEVNAKGDQLDNELNDFYRKIITISNTVINVDVSSNSPTLDNVRWSLQLATVNLHLEYHKIISGKKGFAQQKWASRTIRFGTSNVITSMNTSMSTLTDPDAVKPTETEVGLLQALRGTLPKVIYHLKNGFLSSVIGINDEAIYLTNPKTLKSELVNVNADDLEMYTTNSGLEKFINRFFVKELRQKPIRLAKHYLGLMYIDNNSFKFFKDIDELPDNLSKDNVFPITLSALLYGSAYNHFKRISGTQTRYPTTERGSTVPVFFRVKTTKGAAFKYERLEDWSILETEERRAKLFPSQSPDAVWFSSQSPHPLRLRAQGGDFDGDKNNAIMSMADDSYEETVKYYNSRSSIVGPKGRLDMSAEDDVIELVVANLMRKS